MAGPYGFALLKSTEDGCLTIYSTHGLLVYFQGELVGPELVLRCGLGGGESTEVHYFHFRLENGALVLRLGIVDVMYTGLEWPIPLDSEYQVHMDFVSGKVSDGGGIPRPDLSDIHRSATLQSFLFELIGL